MLVTLPRRLRRTNPDVVISGFFYGQCMCSITYAMGKSMADHATKSSSLPASFWSAAAFVWLVMFSLASLSPFMTDNYLFSKNMTPGYAQFMAGAPIESLEPMTLTAAFDQSVPTLKAPLRHLLHYYLLRDRHSVYKKQPPSFPLLVWFSQEKVFFRD